MSLSLSTLECKLSNALLSIISILAKTHPSEALSLLTQSDVAARSRGDVLEMLTCSNISVNILSTLKYKGRYVSRPLVSFSLRNETFIGQVYPDNRVYLQIGFFESYNYLMQSTFVIANKLYTFKNYSLIPSSHSNLHSLFYHLDVPSASFPSVDFNNLFRHRPKHNSIDTDFANVMSLAKQNQILTEKMYRYFGDLPDSSSLKPESVTVDQMVGNDLFSYLSHVTNPFTIHFLLFLQIINQCWGLFLCLFVIKEVYIFFKEKLSAKEEAEYNDRSSRSEFAA